jgi:hypothetical protein
MTKGSTESRQNLPRSQLSIGLNEEPHVTFEVAYPKLGENELVDRFELLESLNAKFTDIMFLSEPIEQDMFKQFYSKFPYGVTQVSQLKELNDIFRLTMKNMLFFFSPFSRGNPL